MELAIQTSGTYEDVVEVATWAENRGLAAVAVPDHYLYGDPEDARPAPDALVQLAGLARDTDRIELVSLVSPITFRHPAVHAKSAIGIDRMSGGRFSLGLGTGWMDAEHELFGFPYPDLATRFELLEEQLAYVRAVIENRPFQGTHYQLGELDIQPRPAGKLKLVVGGAGPKKTPRLAGVYADEFNAYARPIDTLRANIEAAWTHATEAGRDPADLAITTACVPVIGSDDADYQRAKERAAEIFGTDVDGIEDRLDRAGVIHGTPTRVAETLAAWQELGVERYYAQVGPLGNDAEGRERLYDVLRAAAPA